MRLIKGKTPAAAAAPGEDHPAAAAAPRRQLTVDNVQLTVIANINLLAKIELDFYNFKPP